LCGITGFTTKNWDGAARAHSGSDGHADPSRSRPARCLSIKPIFDGATRLKITIWIRQSTDFDGGRRTGIVFNGEIYNHLELGPNWKSWDTALTSHSDNGNCFLRAFLQWDKDCFPRTRHVCDCVIGPKSKKRIVSRPRDRMGIKPLYIARIAERSFFGSELKALFVHPEIDRRLSLHGLDCYLALIIIPCPWTLVDGIEKLRREIGWMDQRKVFLGLLWRLPLAFPPLNPRHRQKRRWSRCC